MRKKLGAIIAGLALVVGLGACGTASSATNELCLIYSGGLTENATFEGLLDPGANNDSIGMGSDTYCYRIDQRSYIASATEGKGDTGPVQVVSQDDVRLNTEYQLYFKLNRSEEIIHKFHDDLGRKTEAWKKDGWDQLLREYFEPQIERSLETSALKHNWRDLYASEEARVAFQNDTVATLKRNIREVIGDDYFCGPKYDGPGTECGDFTFTVGKPTPVNGDIVGAVEAEQTARAATIAQEQENARIRAELEVEKELVELYGPEGALLREAIKSGKIQMMVIPQGDGSSVAIPVPQQQEE